MEILQLLREFFLLGRGEFAMALTQQADEKMRSRWRRADNLAYEKRDGLGTVAPKEGEVAAVLVRTWAALGSMQGQHAEEDEGLELARDLLRLTLAKSTTNTPLTPAATDTGRASIAPTPFRNLLFSVPAIITLQIPAPLDLFLSSSDLQVYTAVNSYLLSIRRAHIRLTELWKITSIRRHHPSPPAPPYGSSRAGKERICLLRERHASRGKTMRRAWATSSAAIFLLAETEAYLQTEVVAGLWEGFQRWLLGGRDEPRQGTAKQDSKLEDDQDIWLTASDPDQQDLPAVAHDPQSLAVAHRSYLRALVRNLLLSHQPFTGALYGLLVNIDRLVALVHRLSDIWASVDLEADVGVIDAFVDHNKEEHDVRRELGRAEDEVRAGVEAVVGVLRTLEAGMFEMVDGAADASKIEDSDGAALDGAGGEYMPRRVGGVERLSMKLDFGTWFDSARPADGGLGQV
jgi:hypothetical protein